MFFIDSIKVFEISRDGLKRRNILNSESKNEDVYLNPVKSFLENGKSPSDELIEKFSNTWLEGYDVVYGSRFIGSEKRRVLYFWHRVGNFILTLLSNSLSNLNLTDMEVGYKAFKTKILKEIELNENRFGFEPEITAKISKIRPRLRIYEVGISYRGRTYEEGKKIGWKDGFRAIYAILKYNLFR